MPPAPWCLSAPSTPFPSSLFMRCSFHASLCFGPFVPGYSCCGPHGLLPPALPMDLNHCLPTSSPFKALGAETAWVACWLVEVVGERGCLSWWGRSYSLGGTHGWRWWDSSFFSPLNTEFRAGGVWLLPYLSVSWCLPFQASLPPHSSPVWLCFPCCLFQAQLWAQR